MYRERTSRLSGALVWTSTARGGVQRIVPDGCIDLLWVDDRLLVAGPDTQAHLVRIRPGAVCAGVRFAPGTGPAVLGVPADTLRDLRVPLNELWPAARVRRLTEAVAGAAATDAPAVGRALDELAVQRLRQRETGRAAVFERFGLFGQGGPPASEVAATLAGNGSVRAAAREAGLGERQFHRRCLTAFGYGPKTLARVLRLHQALALARTGTALAEAAAVAGYADQAHFAREARALTGLPPRVLSQSIHSTVPSGENRSTPLPSGSSRRA